MNFRSVVRSSRPAARLKLDGDRRQLTSVLLSFIIFLLLGCWMVYFVLTLQVLVPSQINDILHSVLSADYSADPRGRPLPPVQFSIIGGAISEHGGTNVPGAVATLTTGLLTPIPSITPPPGVTFTPEPASQTPTLIVSLVSATPLALETAASTMMPSMTPTLALPTPSSTSSATPSPTFWTPFPTNTLIPTRRPTATNPPPEPTEEDTPIPPSTSTPVPTAPPPTGTPPPLPTSTPPPPATPTSGPTPYP